MVHIKFFASLREQLGIDNMSFDTEFPLTIMDLIQQLQAQNDKFSLLNEGNVLVAKNQEITELSDKVQSNDEVAFFPPVTGG